MFDVGGGEILLIVLAILLLFGPRKIPEIASMVGNGMRKVRRAQEDFTQHLRDLSTELEQSGESNAVSHRTEFTTTQETSALPADSFEDRSDETEGSVPSDDDTPVPLPDNIFTENVVSIRPADGTVSR